MLAYIGAALAACLLSSTLSIGVESLATKAGVIDRPGGRKIHKRPTPLLGGVAVFLSFFIILFFFRQWLIIGDLTTTHWLWFFAGAAFLMIGGVWDDVKNLPPSRQLIFPILAVACVIIGGIGIEKISNPFGGLLMFGNMVSDAFTVVWLMAIMYTTKLLDGVDGLVSGVSVIGGLIIFLFTATTRYFQPDIAMAAIIFAGACGGFLIRNWHPAKIFLGEGGSLFMGYVLGVLSIISGGKIAIALLVLGLPILDVAWTIVRRTLNGKNPFKTSDRKHLHHRFLDLGLSQRKTSLLYYAISAFFGLSGLFLQSRGKMMAISVLLLIMASLIAAFSIWEKRKITK
jgi:UDP-GlcNAc:undecaprenyl-phosphate/decaprenyl-phosphate GlcNAc-1-phosphate transferase